MNLGTLIGLLLFAAVLLWVASERVLSRFQRAGRGAESVRRELAGRGPGDGTVDVTVWRAHPLTDHMIKEIALSKGYRFVLETSTNGSRVLRFARPRTKGAH